MTDPPRRIDSTAARLTVAGLVAPFSFIALVILQGFLQPRYTLMIAYVIGFYFKVRPASVLPSGS